MISLLNTSVLGPKQQDLMTEQRERGRLLVNQPGRHPARRRAYVPSKMPTNTTPVGSPAWDYPMVGGWT